MAYSIDNDTVFQALLSQLYSLQEQAPQKVAEAQAASEAAAAAVAAVNSRWGATEAAEATAAYNNAQSNLDSTQIFTNFMDEKQASYYMAVFGVTTSGDLNYLNYDIGQNVPDFISENDFKTFFRGQLQPYVDNLQSIIDKADEAVAKAQAAEAAITAGQEAAAVLKDDEEIKTTLDNIKNMDWWGNEILMGGDKENANRAINEAQAAVDEVSSVWGAAELDEAKATREEANAKLNEIWSLKGSAEQLIYGAYKNAYDDEYTVSGDEEMAKNAGLIAGRAKASEIYNQLYPYFGSWDYTDIGGIYNTAAGQAQAAITAVEQGKASALQGVQAAAAATRAARERAEEKRNAAIAAKTEAMHAQTSAEAMLSVGAKQAAIEQAERAEAAAAAAWTAAEEARAEAEEATTQEGDATTASHGVVGNDLVTQATADAATAAEAHTEAQAAAAAAAEAAAITRGAVNAYPDPDPEPDPEPEPEPEPPKELEPFLTLDEYNAFVGYNQTHGDGMIFDANIRLVSDTLRQIFKNQNEDLDKKIAEGEILINTVKFQIKNVMRRLLQETQQRQEVTDYTEGDQYSNLAVTAYPYYTKAELRPLGIYGQEIFYCKKKEVKNA